ncbi:hypothetical protein LEP1GSC041_3644 [Leptospira noguchii str. 2006001870]|nr:hypothetical protein LEP1GSC041_3644 [Leptospira noguchii str. 2006001870]
MSSSYLICCFFTKSFESLVKHETWIVSLWTYFSFHFSIYPKTQRILYNHSLEIFNKLQ